MPEYLAPGVYVEEIDTDLTPIPGVSTSTLDTETARRLVAAMEPVLGATPEWTQFNDHDPGVTLIQLFAHLGDGLLYRSTSNSDRRRKALLHAAARWTAAAGGCAKECEVLRRPNYFTGRFLDAATLQSEQDYHREKRRLHNRNLHGFGVVSGLEVRVEATSDPESPHVVIEPGYGIDRGGDEIAVHDRVRFTLPPNRDAAFLSLRHWDHPCTPMPNQAGTVDAGCTEDVCLLAIVDEVLPPAFALARLVRSNGRWTLDSDFVPPRA